MISNLVSLALEDSLQVYLIVYLYTPSIELWWKSYNHVIGRGQTTCKESETKGSLGSSWCVTLSLDHEEAFYKRGKRVIRFNKLIQS